MSDLSDKLGTVVGVGADIVETVWSAMVDITVVRRDVVCRVIMIRERESDGEQQGHGAGAEGGGGG